MVPESEKPRITEIQVRMDCHGCIQKIKKSLRGITGIYELNVDIPLQKLTVVGWADPGEILKAIRKARKMATIISHIEPKDTTEKVTEQAPPMAKVLHSSLNEATPPKEAPKNPPPEIVTPHIKPPPVATNADEHIINEEIHIIYGRDEPTPLFYIHQSNATYKPSPDISGYEYTQLLYQHTCYNRPEEYSEDYLLYDNEDGNNILAMFSEQNPNGCVIV